MEITKEQMVQYTIDYSYMEGRMGELKPAFRYKCLRYIHRHGKLPTIANMYYFQRCVLEEHEAKLRRKEELVRRKQLELKQLTTKVTCNIHKKLYAK